MLHYGYIMTEDVKEKKFKRTATMLKEELKKDSNNIYYIYQLSRSYSMHGDVEEAIGEVLKYLDLINDKNTSKMLLVNYYQNAAILMRNGKRYEKTKEVCKKLISIDKNNMDAYYLLGDSYEKTYHREDAIRSYYTYLELNEKFSYKSSMEKYSVEINSLKFKNVIIKRLLFLEEKTERFTTLKGYIKTLFLEKDYINVLYEIIKIYILNNDFLGLKDIYLNIENKERELFEIYLINLLCLINIKQFNNVIENIGIDKKKAEELLKNENQNSYKNLLCYLEKYSKEESFVYLDNMVQYVFNSLKNIDINSNIEKNNNTSILFIMEYMLKNVSIKNILDRNIKKEDIIVFLYKYLELLNINDCHEQSENKSIQTYLKEIMYGFNNNEVKALRLIKECMENNNCYSEILMICSDYIVKNKEKREKEFNDYCEKVKNNIEYLINNNQLSEAKVLIEEYEKIIPNDVDIFSSKAVIYILENKIDKAKEILEQGLKLYNKNFDMLYNLAYIYEQKKEYSNAVKYYSNALESCNDVELKEKISDLVNILRKENNIVEISRRKKMAFFVKQGMESFLNDIIHRLVNDYEIKKIIVNNYSQIDNGMEWADICWFEWCDELIEYGSKHKLSRDKKIICRLHSYEAFNDYIYKVNWSTIDRLIFVAEHIKNHVLSKINIDVTKVNVVANGIDINKYRFKERQKGFNIAYVGYINYKKGPMLLIHTFKKIYDTDNRYKLYIAGKFQDERDILYFKQMIKELKLENNIIFTGWQDNLDKWLEDKNYILCTSVLESQNISVMEAMSKGIRPLIHNFVGANNIYPNRYIWNTIDECVDMLNSSYYNSSEYRSYIEENYSLDKQINRINHIIKCENCSISEDNSFNYNNYWNNRLNCKFDIEGVGYIGLGKTYNKYLYKIRIEILEYIVKNIFETLDGKNILELGPGIGMFTEYFNKYSLNRYDGIDIAEKSIMELRNKYPHFNFTQGDISDSNNYHNNKYDLIFAADVLLHLTDEKKYKNTINLLSNKLEEGGIIILYDPITLIGTKSKSSHVIIRDINEINRILSDANLKIEELIPSSFFMNFPFDCDLLKENRHIPQNIFNNIYKIMSSNVSERLKENISQWLLCTEKKVLMSYKFGLSQKVMVITSINTSAFNLNNSKIFDIKKLNKMQSIVKRRVFTDKELLRNKQIYSVIMELNKDIEFLLNTHKS
ncbi:MAG: glycosyltransferase, partial [Clostridium argentinense]|nr:glycosyltransferase [Clostridium argentinense]